VVNQIKLSLEVKDKVGCINVAFNISTNITSRSKNADDTNLTFCYVETFLVGADLTCTYCHISYM